MRTQNPSRPLRVLQFFGLILLLLSSTTSADDPDPFAAQVAQTDPLPAEEQLKHFHLPPGFEIQLVAAEPEIRKPINLAFDAAGRLYATQSVEYPFAAADDVPHRDVVRVFSDFAPNGRAGRAGTFADGLNIPIGVAPVPGGMMVYSIPEIYFFADADSDGHAERRETLYRGFGFRDTHGMINNLTRGLDGWMYACHGFANTAEVAGTDGQKIVMQSGNTFRLRLDGSHVEYWTHGQVNPFGLSFDPLGNLYSADCHTLPAYMLLRGAWYPSFGKPHDGLGFGPEIMQHSHGSTAIAGVVYYAAEQFPAEYRQTLFIGNPVTARVNHDRLEPHGSTYKAVEQPDFISCDDPWFRPVDLELGPDGALYIADFYNRIIGHYEVPLTHPRRDRARGRIWRVIYTGDGSKPLPQAPDVAHATAGALIELLGHSNFAVRTLATNELVDRIGQEAAASVDKLLEGDGSPDQRACGLWVRERLGGLDQVQLERLAADPERMVRVQLMKALAERGRWDDAIAPLVRGKLSDADGFVRRAAADALGGHPAAENVQPLLDLWAATPADDTHLVQAVRMALRDHLLVPGVYAGLPAAVSADGANADWIAGLSLGAPTADSAEYLLHYVSARPQLGGEAAEYLHHAARYATDERLPSVYQAADAFRRGSDELQAAVVRALDRAAQERAGQLPEPVRLWGLGLAQRLLAAGEAQAALGIQLARDLRLGELHDAVAIAAGRDSKFAGLRPAAIDACVAIDPGRSIEPLGRILGDGAEPLDLRQKAAQALGGINNESAQAELVKNLPSAPDRLAAEIAAALAISPAGGEALLTAAGEGKVSPRLLLERAVDQRLRAAKPTDLEQRLESLTAGLPSLDERLQQFINERREGFQSPDFKAEAALGQKAFQKTCAACHRLAGQGTKIGPDLEGIGNRGLDRLLEDLLDPSRNVDQAFRTTQITTVDGQVLAGLKLREEGQVLILADALGKEVRVSLADIESQGTTSLSPMPANVADIVPPQDFYQLLAYLLAQRAAPAP